MDSFYDPQDVSRRSREPGGYLWVRDDPNLRQTEVNPPSAEELYPTEQLEYQQDREGRWRESRRLQEKREEEEERARRGQRSSAQRREESDASLEVMDIAAYADSLRTASTKYHSQPPTTFSSPHSLPQGRPLPSPGPPIAAPRHFTSSPPSSFQHDHRTSRPPQTRRSVDYHQPPSPNSPQHYPLDSSPFAVLLPPSRFAASPRPSFDSTLASSSTAHTAASKGYHYEPPPEADTPGYFPPDANAPHSAQVFASSAPHHKLPTGRETDEPTLDRETLREFPKWSRDWFKGGEGKDGGGEYAGVGEERWEGGGLTGGDLGEGSSSSPLGGERKLGAGATIEERIKEKRMKKLEREFGIGGEAAGAGGKGKGKQVLAYHVYVVGELDSKGKIITLGPKKRLALRWVEGLFGLATCALALYPALMIKPTPSPPPSGTLPSLLLCIFSVVSLVLILSLLLIRPLCCSSSKPLKHQQHPSNPLLGGGMLIPMGGTGGGGKKGKKGQGMPGGFQVNLVVDPRAFQPAAPTKKKKKKRSKKKKTNKRKLGTAEELLSSSDSSEESSEDEEDETRRPSFVEVMATRERRAWARKWIVRMVWFDVVIGLGWGVVFGVVMVMGKKCPVGGFAGWCDCYNSATAGSVLLCLCFLTSFVFGVQDSKLKDPSQVGDD